METKEQCNFRCNIRPSHPDHRDLKIENFLVNDVSLPILVDYRPEMLPIRNQGNQGSCGAMASIAMKEWQERKNVGLKEYLSAQFLYNNRSNLYDSNPGNNEGMYPRDILKILQKIGTCLEKNYPYGKIEPKDKIPPSLYTEAKKYVIKGYAQVTSADDLKQCLFQNGPCIIAVSVYDYGTSMWKRNRGETLLGGHMMSICGYNEKRFIIRNSWGINWGDKGYTYMPYNKFNLAYECWTTIDDLNTPKNKQYKN